MKARVILVSRELVAEDLAEFSRHLPSGDAFKFFVAMAYDGPEIETKWEQAMMTLRHMLITHGVFPKLEPDDAEAS